MTRTASAEAAGAMISAEVLLAAEEPAEDGKSGKLEKNLPGHLLRSGSVIYYGQARSSIKGKQHLLCIPFLRILDLDKHLL